MAVTLLPNGRWYTTRESFKRTIMDNTAVTDKDDRLDEAIASASEFIEEYCSRIFIPWTGTKEFDFQKSGKLFLGEDLLSSTPTITYNNGNTTVGANNYFLYPLNAADLGKPYEWLELLLTSELMSFRDTKQSDITINGKWGYSEITKNTGTAINDGSDINATVTSITVDSTTVIEVGMTILIDDEQMFVENHAATTTTVVRGVNGTTAILHLNNAIIYAIYPPLQIRQAANALASRAFMRGESAWTDRTQAGDLGFSYFKSMPAEIKAVLDKLRRESPII